MKILTMDRYDVTVKELALLKLLGTFGDKRFSKRFFEAWDSAAKVPAIILSAFDENNDVVGISGFQINSDGTRTLNSFTAVHPDMRRKGIGRSLLEAKIAVVTGYFDIPLRASIHSTNDPALKMCIAANMALTESNPVEGTDGELRVYQSLW